VRRVWRVSVWGVPGVGGVTVGSVVLGGGGGGGGEQLHSHRRTCASSLAAIGRNDLTALRLLGARTGFTCVVRRK
jgi:hypothetical protein